jgi:hypothetical protein
VQGDSFTATITGSNTNFNGTPSVSLSFSNNPSEMITATNVTVITPTVLHAHFSIPSNASTGLWDVNVNSLVLNNGFTVVLAVPTILSIVPSDGNQGASVNTTITGQYTSWSGTPSVYLSFSGDPGETITGTNVVVTNSTHITATFAIPSNASPGFYNVHVDALQLVNGFTVNEVIPAITFMDPNTAHQGDSFNGTVYGQNTTWTGTPSVYLSFSGDPGQVITGTNVVVVNNIQLTADFSVAGDASTGNYTIHVDAISQPNGFTVLAALTPSLVSIVPGNGEQGYLVSTTISGENTSFEGTEPVVSLSLAGNPTDIIPGSNVVVVNNTTITADFDIPYNATPGLYDVNVDDLSLQNSFTVIEVMPMLISIDPDSAYQQATVSTTLKGEDTHFSITDPQVSLSYSANPEEIIIATEVTIINDTELVASFDIPADASVGKWDVHAGETVLPEGFTVLLLTGINDPVITNVRTYPNPAASNIFIENAAGSDAVILDGTGRIIMAQRISTELQVIDISNYARGVYFLRLSHNGNARTEKLMLN